ncbi:NADPH-dependent F420 reductase [Nocardioides sp. GCM10030258]|uniref:NADPH-dependent F420 reductase n=1 Tax=unclassified Nocardioides TaxID=2615069 RepID=UPI00361AE60B
MIGGTGPQGKGLAFRFAAAGHAVAIGSRDFERAQVAADEIASRLDGAVVSAGTNGDILSDCDMVLLAVPWDGHGELVRTLAERLAGRVVISCVNPLGFDKRGPFGLEVAESAAEEAQRLVPAAMVVGAFHHVAAATLWEDTEPMGHESVLVCGYNHEAKQTVVELARAVTGTPGVDAGALRLARQLEPLTAVLISINKRYRTRSGLAITGLPPATNAAEVST